MGFETVHDSSLVKNVNNVLTVRDGFHLKTSWNFCNDTFVLDLLLLLELLQNLRKRTSDFDFQKCLHRL